MGCAMRMKAMSMAFCALFAIGALGATPSAFALDGRAEVSNAFAYLLSALADVESVLSENVEISNSILSVEGAKGGFRAAKADYRLSDNAKKSIEEIRQYSVDREENMSRYGDVVRSTEIIPEYMTVVSSDSKDSVFQYSVLYKRDLPQLSEEGDEWVERVEYDVEFGGGGIIENIIARNLNYYLQQEDDFENILPDNALMERLERSTTSVNRSSIVSYATKYAYNYNPAYISYAAQHADCTNFASQAMYAGGWKKNYEWMGNDVATTNAWAVADDFYWYGLGRSLTTYANMIPVSGSPYQTMRTGDLMFFTYSGSRKIKHAMIITKIINGEAYLTYHSNDNLNAPFSSIVTKVEPNTSFVTLNVTP